MSACSGGACTGACKPAEKHCGLEQTPETCDALGVWVPEGQACPNVCSGKGECTGECKPGVKRCAGDNMLTPETCDESGKWVAGTACANICSSGSCGGSCSPSTKRCGSNGTPETCSAMGTWEPGQACPFVCSGEGECGGECKPGTKKCDGLGLKLCDPQGMWHDMMTCPFLCTNNACTGVCQPGMKKCNGSTPQTCSAQAQWMNGSACPKVGDKPGSCSGGECGAGQCPGDSKECPGNLCKPCCNGDNTCGSGRICENYKCITPCMPPANGCTDNPNQNKCKLGVGSCATGAPKCVDGGNKPAGSPCENNPAKQCNGSGACVFECSPPCTKGVARCSGDNVITTTGTCNTGTGKCEETTTGCAGKQCNPQTNKCNQCANATHCGGQCQKCTNGTCEMWNEDPTCGENRGGEIVTTCRACKGGKCVNHNQWGVCDGGGGFCTGSGKCQLCGTLSGGQDGLCCPPQASNLNACSNEPGCGGGAKCTCSGNRCQVSP